jgi:Arc/MetJ-type ribon-helix-helix transcriptional regulator
MNIAVSENELEQFVQQQIELGRFGSAEQVVAHALSRLKDDLENAEELEPEAVQSILRANDQIAAGHYLTSEQMRERLRREVFRK